MRGWVAHAVVCWGITCFRVPGLTSRAYRCSVSSSGRIAESWFWGHHPPHTITTASVELVKRKPGKSCREGISYVRLCLYFLPTPGFPQKDPRRRPRFPPWGWTAWVPTPRPLGGRIPGRFPSLMGTRGAWVPGWRLELGARACVARWRAGRWCFRHR